MVIYVLVFTLTYIMVRKSQEMPFLDEMANLEYKKSDAFRIQAMSIVTGLVAMLLYHFIIIFKWSEAFM